MSITVTYTSGTGSLCRDCSELWGNRRAADVEVQWFADEPAEPLCHFHATERLLDRVNDQDEQLTEAYREVRNEA